MNSPSDSQSSKQPSPKKSRFKLPKKEDMGNALRLAAEARELTEEELRYLFRELAKDLLNPNSETILTICDNEGQVLGYFEPVLRHFRSKADQIAVPLKRPEELMEGSVPFEDLVNSVLHSHQATED